MSRPQGRERRPAWTEFSSGCPPGRRSAPVVVDGVVTGEPLCGVVACGRVQHRLARPAGFRRPVPGWQRLAVWRTRNVVIIVGDPAASRRALAERTLGCPKPACSGRLRPWTAARARWVHGPAGARLRVRPDRGRCTVCGATQVLLPAACLPRRAYTAAVVGAVLLDVERGHRVARAAATHRVPVTTARRWVAAVTRSAAAVTATAVRVAAASGDTTGCWPRFGSPRPASRLAGVLHALGGAAAAWTTARAVPAARLGRTGALTRIDYLAQVCHGHQVELLRGLGVADPTEVLGATVTGWPLVNALTGGALLTSPG